MKILVGFLIFFISTFFVPVTSVELMERKVEKNFKKIIKNSVENGYLNKNYDLKVNVKNIEMMRKGSLGEVSDTKCQLFLEVDENGNLTEILVEGEDELDLKSNKEREIHDKFIVLHEASHCFFREIMSNTSKDAIKIKNNEFLQKKVNYYYKNSDKIPAIEMSDIVNKVSLRNVIDEAFADVYAIMQIIKEEKDDKALKNIIIKLEYKRYKYELYRKFHSDEIFSHSTHYLFKEILKENNIELIKKTDKSELMDLALEFANNSIGSLIVNNDIDYVLDNFVVIKGSVDLLKNFRNKRKIQKKDNIQYKQFLIVKEQIKNGQYKNLQEKNLEYNRMELGRLGYYLYDLLEDDEDFQALKKDLFNYYHQNFEKSEMYEIKASDDKGLNFDLFQKRLLIEKERFLLKLKEVK